MVYVVVVIMGLTSTSSSSSSPRISRESDTRETSWSASSLRHSPCSLHTNNTAATSCLFFHSLHPVLPTTSSRENVGMYPPYSSASNIFHSLPILTLAPSPGHQCSTQTAPLLRLLSSSSRGGKVTPRFPLSFFLHLPSPSSASPPRSVIDRQ